MSAPVILALMSFCFLFFGYLGVPVPFSLLAGVFVGATLADVSLAAIIQKIFDGVDSEALLAIPFFLLVGELMSSANVVVRIANLSVSLVGHIRGGLSQVVVVFSMFFSEMSGSTTADVAVMSRALGGPMRREGYEPAFIAAIIASASTIAALVPPSITAVVYGAVGNVSIAGLFMAGVVPGFMIGFGLMIYCYFFGPSGMRKPRAPLRQVVFAAGDAALPLMIPVILLGGILTGWFTPTEAGVVAVIWIILVVIPALNRGHLKKIPYDFCLAGLIFSLPLITIGAANAFGWMLAYLRGAIVIADWITSIAGNDPHYIMLLMVLLFTVIGDFIEPVPTIIIFMPLVNALTQAGDINGVHMGVVLIATLAFGLITPPYGLVLLDGVEIRRRQFRQGAARGAADLCGVPDHDHVHDLFSKRGAVAAEAGDPGIGRLLQVAGGDGVYLSERIIGVVPAKAGTHNPRLQFYEERLPLCLLDGSRGYGSRPSPGRRAEFFSLLPLARELLHGDAELFRLHGFDDLRLLGVELLLGRRHARPDRPAPWCLRSRQADFAPAVPRIVASPLSVRSPEQFWRPGPSHRPAGRKSCLRPEISAARAGSRRCRPCRPCCRRRATRQFWRRPA